MVERNSEDKAYILANISRLKDLIKECPENDRVGKSSLEDMLEQFREQLQKIQNEH